MAGFFLFLYMTQGAGSQEGSLHIIGAQFKNEGRYTCVATTGMDQIELHAYVTVVGE